MRYRDIGKKYNSECEICDFEGTVFVFLDEVKDKILVRCRDHKPTEKCMYQNDSCHDCPDKKRCE